MQSYVNDLGLAGTEEDLFWVSKSLHVLSGARWVGLRLSKTDAANLLVFLFWRMTKKNQFISHQNFIPEFSKLWHLLVRGFNLASQKIRLLAFLSA